MSADLSESQALSYSTRYCRRCRSSMTPSRGFLGRTTWRCEQCKPGAPLR